MMSTALSKVKCLKDTELMSHLTDVVFLATPAEISLKLADEIVKAGKVAIDISGAFRLKQHDYKSWYGFEHHNLELLKTAHYGLRPFSEKNTGKLLANPGCYATAITMALIPLIKENVITTSNIVIDAKSGTSGAGKKASESMLFTEVDGECLPYKVGRHQHYPEIVEVINHFANTQIDFHLTTSLLPTRRGIIAGVYAELENGKTIEDVTHAFARAFANYPLVQYGKLKDKPYLLSLKKVLGTAKTHISYEVVGKKVYVFSLIDNLMKGAASQAVENLNNLYGFQPFAGLTQLEAII